VLTIIHFLLASLFDSSCASDILLSYVMPRKCTVYGCGSGYSSSAQSTELDIKIYRFPKDDGDLQKPS